MKPAVALILAAAMAVLASSAASAAVTFTTSNGPLAGSEVETFDNLSTGNLSGTTSLDGIGGASLTVNNGVSAITNGSTTGVNAAPFPKSGIDTTNYLSVTGGSSVTITLARTANYLGLLWGSVDLYNEIDFVDQKGNVTKFDGADFAVNNGNQGADGTFYANFVSTIPFLKIILTSSSNSFEVDNVAVSNVPLPAALPLFGAALLGMGAFARKRRQNGSLAI